MCAINLMVNQKKGQGYDVTTREYVSEEIKLAREKGLEFCKINISKPEDMDFKNESRWSLRSVSVPFVVGLVLDLYAFCIAMASIVIQRTLIPSRE